MSIHIKFRSVHSSEHVYREYCGRNFVPLQQLEEIVRCRDCDYYDHWDASGRYREKHVCGHWDYLEIEPDGFCAWGERKERIES